MIGGRHWLEQLHLGLGDGCKAECFDRQFLLKLFCQILLSDVAEPGSQVF